jgi:hypothetical protein
VCCVVGVIFFCRSEVFVRVLAEIGAVHGV